MDESVFSKYCKVTDGVLAANASSAEVTAEVATSLFDWANDKQSFHSLLIHGSSEFKEPYYWTVGPWIEGLINSGIRTLKSFRVDDGTTMNRQFGNYIGDITPVLKNNVELDTLYLSGAYKCSNYSHDALQQIFIANCYLSAEDLGVLSNADLPALRTIAVYDGDAGISNPEFNSVLVESLSKLNAANLADLYLCDWSDCDDFLTKLIATPVLSQLELLHLDTFEFADDPEEGIDLLMSHADVLSQLSKLRIPFKGFMEDEVAQLKTKIPGLENCTSDDGRSLNPF